MKNKVTRLSFYLEVEAKNRKEVKNKLGSIAQELITAKIKGHGVYDLINETRTKGQEVYGLGIKSITKIPHFGHGWECEKDCGDNHMGIFYRVMTSSTLLVKGEPNESIKGHYKLNDYTLVVIRRPDKIGTRICKLGDKALEEWNIDKRDTGNGRKEKCKKKKSKITNCGSITLKGRLGTTLDNFLRTTAIPLAQELKEEFTNVKVNWNGVELDIEPNSDMKELVKLYHDKGRENIDIETKTIKY